MIGDWIRQKAETNGDRELISVSGRTLSYAELDRQTDRVAAGLASLGLDVGDSACLMMRNSVPNIIAWLGMCKAGIVEVPLNVALKGFSFSYQISQSDSKAILVDEEFLPRLAQIAGELPNLRHVLVNRSGGGAQIEADLPKGIEVSDLSSLDGDGPISAPKLSPGTPSTILYTSGTTGPSKGVVVTHNYNLELSRNVAELMRYEPDDVLYTVFPLYHANAKYATFMAAMHADARVVMDDRFTASGFWDICRERRVSAFNYMGALLLMLWKQPPREEDREHGVRKAFGAPCPPDLWEPFEARFGVRLVDVYGSTEVGLATVNTLDDRNIGTAGRAGPGYQVTILDEEDNEVEPGVPGQIAIRAGRPHEMISEYYKMPEATVAAFKNFWFHTGDRGSMDGDGYLTFIDRMKDAIRRRGENISSWEVEQVVNKHEAVLESAAYGVDSEFDKDEEVAVAVVLRDGRTLEAAELLDYCQNHMAHFSVPRFVRIMEELPKTPSQRVQKYKLREEGIAPGIWDREQADYTVHR